MKKRKFGRFDFKYAEKLADKLIGVRLFAADKEKLKELALSEGISETELIRRIVNEYFRD